jgi:SNF family Na+-dependent transporter
MDNAGGGAQLITMLVTFALIGIPIALMNAAIAKRKGKSGAFYGWMSIIPAVGYFMVWFLISLTDKAIVDKIDRLLEIAEKKV